MIETEQELRTQLEELRLREEQARLAFEAAPTAKIMVDERGDIVLVNRQTEKLFGYDRKELLGRPVEILVPARFRGRHSGYRAGFMAQPQARPMGAGRDLYGLRKDGTEVPVEIGLNPFRTSQGLFVLAAIVDITERKKSEERLRLVIEAAPNAMVMVDRRGKITLVNGQTEKLFGYDRRELIGRPVEMLVPERYRGAHPGHREEFFARPSARPMGAGRDLYGLRKDGAEIPIEIGLNPLESPEGPAVLASIIDITERRRAELARQAEELARSNADLEQFAYVASHDLQEPLRMVSSYCQLLERRYAARLDARAREYIRFAVDGAKRMHTLLEGLLAYSRAGRKEKAYAMVDCSALLDRVLENLQVAVKESGALVTREDLPTVEADPSQMLQLFQNLVGNGIKFRRPGEAPRLHVACRSEGPSWHFTVRDNGIGIDEGLQGRIFNIFQRLHTAAEYPGSGIGLALCKKILDRHGGRIWVESCPGKGSTFHFAIPKRRSPHA